MRIPVGVVGVAQTPFKACRNDVNVGELAYEAIEAVLMQTGLDMNNDIDGRISCSHDIWDGQTISDIGVTDVIGAHLKVEDKMAMDGLTAVYYGTIGIVSGEHRCTLLLAHTKMSQTDRHIVNNDAFDPIYSRLLGFDYTSAAALQMCRYMHRYKLKPEDMAAVSVKNLGNARLNPGAVRAGAYSVHDVLDSPELAAPITELQASPDCDGAVAMILAHEDFIRERGFEAVWVRGIGSCYDAHYLGDRDLADNFALQKAAGQAYCQAGIKNPLEELDLIELSEEFSYQEPLWLEGLGICSPGEGCELLKRGITLTDGVLPVNSSGGVLAGVPANVMGLNQAAEVILQLSGQAGERQLPDVRRGLAQGHSGFCGQHQCVVIFEKE